MANQKRNYNQRNGKAKNSIGKNEQITKGENQMYQAVIEQPIKKIGYRNNQTKRVPCSAQDETVVAARKRLIEYGIIDETTFKVKDEFRKK